MKMYIGERDMQGSVTALKAAPKLHSYNSSRNINSDTQKYTYIMHFKKTYTYMSNLLIFLEITFRTASARFSLQADCPCCHPTNNVKALKGDSLFK